MPSLERDRGCSEEGILGLEGVGGHVCSLSCSGQAFDEKSCCAPLAPLSSGGKSAGLGRVRVGLRDSAPRPEVRQPCASAECRGGVGVGAALTPTSSACGSSGRTGRTAGEFGPRGPGGVAL